MTTLMNDDRIHDIVGKQKYFIVSTILTLCTIAGCIKAVISITTTI